MEKELQEVAAIIGKHMIQGWQLGLEHGAEAIDLQQVAHLELDHRVAVMRRVGHESLALEDLQCLADRHPTDPEAFRERVLHDRTPGCQLAAEDGRPHLGQDRLLRRPPAA